MRNLSIALVAALGLLVVSQTVEADPVGGTQVGNDAVEAYSTDVFTVRCYGGEVTRVVVDGDGDTDLDQARKQPGAEAGAKTYSGQAGTAPHTPATTE